MQQYSSLPEQNSLLDATPTPLRTIQQLRAELWLERSLNQLQDRLNDYLISACTTLPQSAAPEAEILQILVNELHIALNRSRVAIALCQPQETVSKICYVSRFSSRRSQRPLLRLKTKTGKKLQLRLFEEIDIEDLQHLENQQPPRAWRLTDVSGSFICWLIINTSPPKPGCNSLKASITKLRSQLFARATKQCAVALLRWQKMQSHQQQFQELDSFNQELERTNQLKNQFLANTSHEIRTPLSSIIGFTHLLLAQGYDSTRERHQEYLNIILSSGKHLLALINDILDLSKIEANQLEVQWESVNLPALCRNVLVLVKEKAAHKSLKLLLDLDPDATTLIADPLRLKQMLLNLLFNALKFTTTGTVGLKVYLNGLFVHFIVWDTGTGIPKENQDQLFQPYFQIPNAAVNREEGTGLGLAVTRKLAEIHGGWIEVDSEVDRGSRFTIVLPLLPPGVEEEQKIDIETEEALSLYPPFATSDSKHSFEEENPTPSDSLDILLVEDDSFNAQMMQTYLEKLGYQVTWVKNAAEMWATLGNLHPGVILMDIHLPDVNGLKLVQQLRKNQQHGTVPIIAQTAMSMKGDREICLAAGVNEYISKPIDLPFLASLVSKYIAH